MNNNSSWKNKVLAIIIGGLTLGVSVDALASYWLGTPAKFWTDVYPDDPTQPASACAIPTAAGTVRCYWIEGGDTASCYGGELGDSSSSLCANAGGTFHTAPGGSGVHCDLPDFNNPCL